jgi:hypothetical protein
MSRDIWLVPCGFPTGRATDGTEAYPQRVVFTHGLAVDAAISVDPLGRIFSPSR